MKPLFLFRLILDLLAVSLLLAAFAYNWFGNAAHEIIGTLMFLLLIGHNVFNGRWYGVVAKGWREPRSMFSKTITLCLLVMMLGLLVSSVIISRTVFDFLPFRSTFTVRQIHALVAYIVLGIAALHVGLQWTMIMRVVGNASGLKMNARLQTLVLRVLASLIAIYGVHSLYVIDIGPKLRMESTLSFWDFEAAAIEFVLRHAAIVVLCGMIAHYGLKLLTRSNPARRTTGVTK
ncbi:DUF4405 domain-containing protein [Agrobacterium tumefaciens]|uniref:DUF4405 domain-containing protein n=1 Tax=Agrobacterium tumefaciens TaxID=358 RepID=UPI0013AAC8A2|nr:DUF4405 domain-containing protein [Agrobacterium tumefaciens]MRH98218.1 DUF4405 domain-containing protein [Agrobacterium tumefaciens]